MVAEITKINPEASKQGESNSVMDVEDVGFGGAYLL
tara:strand:- start:79 stop:186 length:108 start_codon:yes stop_codon:yes gene_type:complete